MTPSQSNKRAKSAFFFLAADNDDDEPTTKAVRLLLSPNAGTKALTCFADAKKSARRILMVVVKLVVPVPGWWLCVQEVPMADVCATEK
jgi:hypothetical protein